jgi:hypothetical protein
MSRSMAKMSPRGCSRCGRLPEARVTVQIGGDAVGVVDQDETGVGRRLGMGTFVADLGVAGNALVEVTEQDPFVGEQGELVVAEAAPLQHAAAGAEVRTGAGMRLTWSICAGLPVLRQIHPCKPPRTATKPDSFARGLGES